MPIWENIVDFFKSRLTNVKIGPRISVDYNSWASWDGTKFALKEQWESLLKVLETNPKIVKERKWSEHSDGTRTERINIDIDGVVMQLDGPSYSDPNYTQPPTIMKTDAERGNEAIDYLFHSTNIPYAVSHATEAKFNAFIEYLKASRESNKHP